MKVAIVKYNAGNVQSVTYALNRLGINPLVTDNADELHAADCVIFPGVGEAASAMRYLKAHHLHDVLRSLKQPVFGICLGQQLLCEHSEEGDTECLGIFDVLVKKFPATDKVPQIGWNEISSLKSPLFANVKERDYVYFVHSFYAELSPYTIATSDYTARFSAALHRDNFYAAQFHPEKSSQAGNQIIQNFLDIARSHAK